MAIKKTQYRFTTMIRFQEKDFIQLLVTCNTFPSFLTIQIDQSTQTAVRISSSIDHGKLWKTSLNGFGVQSLPWKKRLSNVRRQTYSPNFSLQLSMYMWNESYLPGVSLRFCAGGQWGFSAGHFKFFLWKKVRREDKNSQANWWRSLVHSQSICPVPGP